VVQTRREISISMDVLSEVDIGECYLWWDQMGLDEFGSMWQLVSIPRVAI